MIYIERRSGLVVDDDTGIVRWPSRTDYADDPLACAALLSYEINRDRSRLKSDTVFTAFDTLHRAWTWPCAMFRRHPRIPSIARTLPTSALIDLCIIALRRLSRATLDMGKRRLRALYRHASRRLFVLGMRLRDEEVQYGQ